MNVYADTSFILPLYVADRHSAVAQIRMRQRPIALLTPFQGAEVANAIFQQVFRKQISGLEANRIYSTFLKDVASGVWLELSQPERTFAACVDLARRHVGALGVRTLDTLHVAAALELKADRFWTFDERQKQLAEAEGLATS